MPRAFHADPAAHYFTDNGAVLCGDHLGASAKYTGRDISGQPIERVTPEDVRDAKAMGWEVQCEHCRKPASLLVSVA